MIFFTKILMLLILSNTLLPTFVFANGGDQRVVENKYIINLSKSPFTPRAGAETSFLASFVDIQSNKLISGDINVDIRIAKRGGGEKREFIFDQENAKAKSGILDFKYTFEEEGIYEIFFDFSLASNPSTIYSAPDFLVDVQKPVVEAQSNKALIVSSVMGVVIAFAIGLLIGRSIKAAQKEKVPS